MPCAKYGCFDSMIFITLVLTLTEKAVPVTQIEKILDVDSDHIQRGIDFSIRLEQYYVDRNVITGLLLNEIALDRFRYVDNIPFYSSFYSQRRCWGDQRMWEKMI